MKQLLIVIAATITFSSINCMNNDKLQDWNAGSYERNAAEITNRYAFNTAEQSCFSTLGKTVLDVGCGTARTPAKLAQLKWAQHIHCIDSSKNMINFAQRKYRSRNNLTFTHTSIEKLNSVEKYDAATSFFCFNYIIDKSLALKKINQALKDDGEFFGTIRTHPAPEFDLLMTKNAMRDLNERNYQQIQQEALKNFKCDYSLNYYLQEKLQQKQQEAFLDQFKHEQRLTTKFNKQINENKTLTAEQKQTLRKKLIYKQRQKLSKLHHQDPTGDEFKTMLTKNGFEIISYETKDLTLITAQEETLRNFLWSFTLYHPLVQSLPKYEGIYDPLLIQSLPEPERTAFFMYYADNYAENIEQPARRANNYPSELRQCKNELSKNNNSDSRDITNIRISTLTQNDEVILSSSIENCNPKVLEELQLPTVFGGKKFYIAPLIRNTIVFHVRKIKEVSENSTSENNEK